MNDDLALALKQCFISNIYFNDEDFEPENVADALCRIARGIADCETGPDNITDAIVSLAESASQFMGGRMCPTAELAISINEGSQILAAAMHDLAAALRSRT
jgi:hypothetical protein